MGRKQSLSTRRVRRALPLRRTTWILLALSGLLLVAVPLVIAQSADEPPFTLPWWTVDAGGGSSEGGGYILDGTAGQPDAGLLEGGGFTLGGGFWRGGTVTPPEYPIYLPLIVRNR